MVVTSSGQQTVQDVHGVNLAQMQCHPEVLLNKKVQTHIPGE